MSKHREKLDPVLQELVDMVKGNHGWEERFNKAIAELNQHKIVEEMPEVHTIEDFAWFLQESVQRWMLKEDKDGKRLSDHLCAYYFVLCRPGVRELQDKTAPGEPPEPQSQLSKWMVKFTNSVGSFLDTPESISEETVKSVFASDNYNMDDYIVPRGGWKSFNAFFARHFKPGVRPIAGQADPTLIVSPADSNFSGQWEIRKNSGVFVKGVHWKIEELLRDTPYADAFHNGIFMHSYLSPNDYHRYHAPLSGKVLQANVIQGHVYLDVTVKDGKAQMTRHFDSHDNVGYQFSQMRGLIVLDTPIGLVAMLPVGMGNVSSVILTAEKGACLQKGDEIGYFQFGGSDMILLFTASSGVGLFASVGTHYRMGSPIGKAFL